MRTGAHLLFAVFLAGAAVPLLHAQSDEDALRERARGIHDRVLTLDTHVDIEPEDFTASCNYTQRLQTQVDLPKMREGGLDVAFFIAYVGQGPLTDAGYADAYRQVREKFDAIHRLTETLAPQQIGLALTADDVARIAASGRKVAVIGIENGYAIGTDVGRVREFWQRGGRYMSLAHNGHNQLSDSNTGETSGDAPNSGISPLGRQVLAEMNRVGMMVDVSHPSRASILQATELSKAPVIASHSAVRSLANHSRNLDDDQLRTIGRTGGVVQIVALSAYIRAEAPENARARAAAIASLQREFGVTPLPGGEPPSSEPRRCPTTPEPQTGPNDAGANRTALAALPAERRDAYRSRLAAVRKQYPPPPRATVKDFVDHIDYAVRLIGVDHVGIASDFDGGGGIDGWNNAAETFNVTMELVRRGYSEQDIGKIWSGNLLRVWRDAEGVARKLQTEAR